MRFITHDLNGKATGAIALVVGGVCVVIGKVEVGWDVGGGLGACEGGVGVVGQGGSEVVVQVERDHGSGGRHGQCECRKPSYNYCGAGAEGLG